jgi:hypothetical protein
MRAEERGGLTEVGRRPPLHWYDPLLAAVRLTVPIVVVLYAVDGHTLGDYFSYRFFRLFISTVAASAMAYLLVGIALLRRRTRPEDNKKK